MEVQESTHSGGQIHGYHRPGGESPDWVKKAEAVSRILHQGGIALIVGARGDNFPPRYHEHPQLLIWSNIDSHSVLLQREIPHNVRAVIFTRFVHHSLSGKLIDVARKRHLHIFPSLGTGEIKKLLSGIVPNDDPLIVLPDGASSTPPVDTQAAALPDAIAESTPEEPMAHVEKPKKGWLMQFIADEGNLTASPAMDEAKRLFEVAKSRGISTTVASVAQALYLTKRNKIGGPVPRGKKQVAAAVTKVASPRASAAKAPAVPMTSSDERIVLDIKNAMGMVSELQSNVASASSIILDALGKLEKEVRQRRERLERMRAELLAEDL